MKFRKLYNDEIEGVVEVHRNVVQLLLSKNIRQWMNPIPLNTFQERQKKGENFGLFDDEGNFLAYASILIKDNPQEWKASLDGFGARLYWLSSLFSNPLLKKHKVGTALLENCFLYLKSIGADKVILDCVVNEGFLINYYKGFGFSVLDEKVVKYRSGDFRMALMKKDIKDGK